MWKTFQGYKKTLLLGVSTAVTVTLLCIWAATHLAVVTADATSPIPTVSIKSSMSSPIVLSHWYVVGPFLFPERKFSAADSDKPFGLNRDFLASVGLTERDLSETTFRKLVGKSHRFTSGQNHTLTAKLVSGQVIDLGPEFQRGLYGIAYAACVITSPTELKIALKAGGNQGLWIFLNNKLISSIANDQYRAYRENDYIVPLSLHKGRNLLVFKVDSKGSMDWGFGASLVTLPQARNEARALNHDLFTSNLVPVGASLKPLDPLYELPVSATLMLEGIGNVGRFYKLFTLENDEAVTLPKLPPGLYRCTLETQEEHRTTLIYIGEVEDAQSQLAREIGQLSLRDSARIEADALMYRLTHLLRPEHKKTTNRDWQNKIIFVLDELNSLILDKSLEKDQFLSTPGFHAYAFRSSIDGSVQEYTAYIPTATRPTSGFPVVLSMAYPGANKIPFKMGGDFSDYLQCLYIQYLANQSGFIFLFTFSRGEQSGSSMQETNFTEVFADLEKRHLVDANRIFLFGTCESAPRAFMLAAHHPDKYAGIMVYGPMMSLGDTERESPHDPASSQDSAQWIKNLINVPILIEIGSKDFISNLPSEEIVKNCVEAGGKCRLEMSPESGHSVWVDNPFHVAVKYFQGKTREQKPVTICLNTRWLRYGSASWLSIKNIVRLNTPVSVTAGVSKNGTISVNTRNIGEYEINPKELPPVSGKQLRVITNGKISTVRSTTNQSTMHIRVNIPTVASSKRNNKTEGPIAEAFSRPFIVVVGTQGMKALRERNRLLGQLFENEWKLDFLVRCREKDDVSITRGDKIGYNLILLGGNESNLIAQQVHDNNGVLIINKSICLGKNCYTRPSMLLRYICLLAFRI